jgi:hypothetical protein
MPINIPIVEDDFENMEEVKVLTEPVNSKQK